MRAPVRITIAGLAVLAGTLSLTACGGSSGSAKASATSSSSSSASASGSASRGRGAGGAGFLQSAQVQQCLKAAGITVPTFSAGARPSGSFTRPSGSFTRPSGSFTRPSGAGGGFGGGFFGTDTAEGQQIQAALKACGITVPTGRAGGGQGSGGAPVPSAAPSS